MRRDQIDSLHYITSRSNLKSILEHGILSHTRASKLKHVDISMAEVQDRRAQIRVPGARRLHEYANLYVHARNPMMYVRQHQPICVVRIDTAVIDLPGVVVADGNAASDWTAFRPGPPGFDALDAGMVLAEYWTDQDYYLGLEKKRSRCAEVLVPDRVDPGMILGVAVRTAAVRTELMSELPGIVVVVDSHLFFG